MTSVKQLPTYAVIDTDGDHAFTVEADINGGISVNFEGDAFEVGCPANARALASALRCVAVDIDGDDALARAADHASQKSE